MLGMALATLLSSVVVGSCGFFMGYRLGYQDGSDGGGDPCQA